MVCYHSSAPLHDACHHCTLKLDADISNQQAVHSVTHEMKTGQEINEELSGQWVGE